MNQDLRISKEDFTAIQKAEAVVVGSWRRGEKEWGEFLMTGTKEECEEYAGESEILIVPDDCKCLGKSVVLVADLLPRRIEE